MGLSWLLIAGEQNRRRPNLPDRGPRGGLDPLFFPIAGGQRVLRFIVGILWIILLVFIILMFLNTPGIR